MGAFVVNIALPVDANALPNAKALLAPDKKLTKLVIGTEGADKPWNFTTANAKLDGVEIELARLFCEKIQAECKIIAQEWSALIPSLLSGKIDAIIGRMDITDKRLEVINFTIPYAVDPYGFVTLEGSPLVSLNSFGDESKHLRLGRDEMADQLIKQMRPILDGSTVGIQTGTSGLAFLKRYFPDTVFIRGYSRREQHDIDLDVGRVDAVFVQQSTHTTGQTLPSQNGNTLVRVGPSLSGGVLGRGIGLGVRKEDKHLTDQLNQAIASSIIDGTVGELFIKWLNRDLSPKE